MLDREFVVGLTGPTGCGKTKSAMFLKKIGFAVIDADEIVAKLYLNCSKLVEKIGLQFRGVVDSNRVLNRKKLAEIVFSSEADRKNLERIVWPYVVRKIGAEVSQYKNKSENVVIDAPVLFESGAFKFCNFSIAILSSKSNRLFRIIQRDGLTKKMAFARINSQKFDDFYINSANGVIFNNGLMSECFYGLVFLIKRLAVNFGFS